MGLINLIKVMRDMMRLYRLKRKYGFQDWHWRTPDNARTYREVVIDIINNDICPNVCVDMGCGMGFVIDKIKAEYKYGIDIDEKVIGAANEWHKENKTLDFMIGGYSALSHIRHDEIDCLLILGVIFDSKFEDIVCIINEIKHYKKINTLVFDSYCHEVGVSIKNIFSNVTIHDDGGDGDRWIIIVQDLANQNATNDQAQKVIRNG